MAVEGTLELFRLPEILQLIAQQQKTGILTVQGQQDIVAISFLNGSIVAADALSQTAEEGLERVLVGAGLVGKEEFAKAAAVHQAGGGRLIDVLVERGAVPRPRLLEGLRLQTYRLLEQVLGWDQGDFKFYSGDEVSYEEGFDPIPVQELLLRAGEAAAEAAARREPPPAAPATAPRWPAAPEPPSPAAAPPAQKRPAVVRPIPPIAAPPAADKPQPALRTTGGAAPAAPAAAPFRKMKVEQPAVPVSARWAGRSLALLLVLLLLAVVLRLPAFLALPFPWQDAQRQALAGEQRRALYLKIDRAAKTFFLQEGRFPEALGELVQIGLLSARDLHDSQGHALVYVSEEDGYAVQPTAGGSPVPGTEAVEAITGNFLLDPEFITVRPDQTETPLVLLD